MSKYYNGDVGTVFKVDTGSDLTGYSTIALEVKKPDGTIVTWTATLDVDNQTLLYTTIAGDLDQDGTYCLQAVVNLPTWQGRGDTALFEIRKDFDCD